MHSDSQGDVITVVTKKSDKQGEWILIGDICVRFQSVRVSRVMQICKWKRAETLVLGRINLNYTAMRGPTVYYVGLLLLAVS
jgi:hypothetical protein